MTDEPPEAGRIIALVAAYLRDKIAPQIPSNARFEFRVATNALELVARERMLGDESRRREHDRLERLLGMSGDLDMLRARLSTLIRNGDLDADSPGLIDHLRRTTLAKVAIDQPSYAAYARALVEWPDESAE